ncbi:MAG: membrane protein insertion efficiency factor YidD [Bacteroidetes bacterium]|uniref:membrane protein insertion efficiency factor YidD n=1 Tax=Methanothrix soehngenii TaxID=2223 RepID=UPI001B4BB942|nr:membrane protein insertion efficiency factor YidD [Bacteroidota bacterium]MBP7256708.1 membrane protein insertion efficiency factor YidD [Chitinophagales bacterium]MBK7139263.1 membrane protein insertion efficiency factor YidD [Bacteroidota bacterium]MBK7503825.1 membrane protein insertion efficiency factor YidD [Bacteroidota bacterium]MBK8674104.1 membrane protein insertion efficiency factor YidD [Bacteroidota bacterium]
MKLIRNFFTFILVGIISLYKLLISPLLGPACRFTPSCSVYSMEAIKKFGPIKGTWLAIKRISSCHPWGRHGHDPVP